MPAMAKPCGDRPGEEVEQGLRLLLQVPDEAEQENAQGGEGGAVAGKTQVQVRHQPQIDDHQQVVGGEEEEAESAPEEQPGAGAAVPLGEKQAAGGAGQEAEQLDGGGEEGRHRRRRWSPGWARQGGMRLISPLPLSAGERGPKPKAWG